MDHHLIQTLTDHARQALNENRFLHVLGVTHTATTLADVHGLDIEATAVAALLHDVSKPIKPPILETQLTAWGVEIPALDRDYPRTWHGVHAAEWGRRELGIEDDAILEAVTLHTTADEGVGPLTKILFIADFTEPLRRCPAAPAVLAAARADLDQGFRQALRTKVAMLLVRGRPVHPRARRALTAYLADEVDEILGAGV